MSTPYYAQNGSGTLAALGTNQATAALVVKQVTTVTGADGTVGVRLPSAKSSTQYLPFAVLNSDVTSALRVYPPVGGSINGGTTNVHISVSALSVVTFIPTGALTYVTSIVVSTGTMGAAGVVTASQGVVVDANKDIGDFRNLDAVNIDLGADAVAGTLDIFPTTTARGKVTISKTDNAGATTTALVVGAMAAARTLTVPDPLAAADFLMGQQAAVARTATADGLTTGTIADAGKIQSITVTAGGDANSIIVLPTPTPGTLICLHVGATGYELRTSTPASIAINGGTGVNAESAIGANVTAFLYCASATSWKGWQLGSDGTLAKVEVAAP